MIVSSLRWGALIWALFTLAVVASSGCVKGAARDSAAALERGFGVYRRSVVPNPAYDDDTKSKVEELGNEIEGHVRALREALN